MKTPPTTEGYLMLARRSFGNFLWREERSLSKFEAWLDLLQLAAFAPTKRIVSGHVIEIERGELIASLRYLSQRWTWKKDKVASYLGLLTSECMIRRETRHGQSVLILCNYEVYNTSGGPKPDSKPDKGQTPARQAPAKVEEVKELKEESAPRDVQEEWSDRFPTETARDFHALQRRINECLPLWIKRPHFTRAEMDELQANSRSLFDIGDDDWKLLAVYLNSDIPADFDGTRKFWQPDSRSMFVKSITDVLNAADRWKRLCKQRKIPTGLEPTP